MMTDIRTPSIVQLFITRSARLVTDEQLSKHFTMTMDVVD